MRAYLLRAGFVLFCCAGFFSCKKQIIYGDVAINTFRPIVEFSEPSGFTSVAMDYSTNEILVTLTDIRFMIRSDVQTNATAKIMITPVLVSEYNMLNGTNYAVLPVTAYSLETDQFTLSPEQRSQPVRIRIKPSAIPSGANAIGIKISESNNTEISELAGTLVIALSVKNKYDGRYELRGHFTRIDNPALNGPFEADVEMITTGANSVVMFWPDADDFGQPFYNNGNPTYFTNVAPEVYFNATDQVTQLVNYTGDPAAGPFMTVFPGSNSRWAGGTTPVIYLKYYYNTNPANRIFADTLVYVGPR